MAKRHKFYITKLQNASGALTSDHEDMKAIAASPFQIAFTSQNHYIEESSLNCIPSLVSQEDNAMLCAVPHEEEI